MAKTATGKAAATGVPGDSNDDKAKVGSDEQAEAVRAASEESKKSDNTLLLKLKNPALSYYDPSTGISWSGDRAIETPHTPYVARALGQVLVQVEE